MPVWTFTVEGLARDYARARKAQAAPRPARRRRQPALAPLLRALRRA